MSFTCTSSVINGFMWTEIRTASLNKGRKSRSWSSGAVIEECKSGEGTAKSEFFLHDYYLSK